MKTKEEIYDVLDKIQFILDESKNYTILEEMTTAIVILKSVQTSLLFVLDEPNILEEILSDTTIFANKAKAE